MPCKPTHIEVVSDPAKDPVRCKCQNAVLNAYKELIKQVPKSNAMEAAELVYGYHHPEDSKEERALIVERWINAEHMH